MTLQMRLLASLHEADLVREAQASRLRNLVTYCRRRILGLFPIRQPCEQCATC